MLRLFLKFEVDKIVKYFKTKTLAKTITSLLFLSVFVFVSIGIYYFFVSGFRYINNGAEEDIRLALSLFLYELFLLVLTGIIIFSATISGIFNLFRSDNNNWIISSPKFSIFPKIVFIKGVISSSLPLLIMFLPAILALNRVYDLSIVSILFILVTVFLFLLFLNALALIVIIFVSFIYYQASKYLNFVKFNFKGLVLLLIFIFSTAIFGVWKVFKSIDLYKIFKADEVSSLVSISNMASNFTYLPTHPVAMQIINWQVNQENSAVIYFFITLTISLVSVYVFVKISSLFYTLWQKFQEGNSNTDNVLLPINKITYDFSGGKILSLFQKEALISSRNFKGVLWFLFLLFIWLMQVGTNVIMNHNIQRHQPDMTERVAILQVLQYLIAIYFISSFALRFVFPSFSTEKKTAWILGSAPLSFTKIFFGKYLFYTLFFVFIGIVMNYINNAVIGVIFTHAFYSMLLFISTIIFIVTFGLSLGALFPNRETDDPEAISTSMPGLFFTAISLIYGAISSFILYKTLMEDSVTYLLAFVITTLIIVGLTLIKVPVYVKNHKI